jgi:hypothetical protein
MITVTQAPTAKKNSNKALAFQNRKEETREAKDEPE